MAAGLRRFRDEEHRHFLVVKEAIEQMGGEHLQSVRRWLAERLEGQLGAKMPSTEFGEPAQPA